MAYSADGPAVLERVSFSIRAGEKVGVVGRTGAGKSTLSVAMFRLVEARDGHFLIDGVDTRSMHASDLRARISIIPQARHRAAYRLRRAARLPARPPARPPTRPPARPPARSRLAVTLSGRPLWLRADVGAASAHAARSP